MFPARANLRRHHACGCRRHPGLPVPHHAATTGLPRTHPVPSDLPIQPVPTPEPPGPPRDRRPLWRRSLPFVTAIALVGFLLCRLDLARFVQHLQRVNYAAFIGFVALFNLALLTADAFATSYVYRRTVCPIRFREFWLIRGFSYLPSVAQSPRGAGLAHLVPVARLQGAAVARGRSYPARLRHHVRLAVPVHGDVAVLPSRGNSLARPDGRPRSRRRPRIPGRHPHRSALPRQQADALTSVRGRPCAVTSRRSCCACLTWSCCSSAPGSHSTSSAWTSPPGVAFAYVPVLMVVVALPITPAGRGHARLVLHALLLPATRRAPQRTRQQPSQQRPLTFVVALTILQIIGSLLLMRRALAMLAPPPPAPSD